MTNEELIKEIPNLPKEVRLRIEKIVAAFRERSNKPSEDRSKRTPLQDEPFVGMWADREDMKDPVEWVRNIRRTQWDRSHRWKE
ncbi:MAG: hypothetical protein KF881_10430 [Acidobacteria bacterium]|nr:hypothetical protein [Acidobacteriota bacterium]